MAVILLIVRVTGTANLNHEPWYTSCATTVSLYATLYPTIVRGGRTVSASVLTHEVFVLNCRD
jgi:hypothetical protein